MEKLARDPLQEAQLLISICLLLVGFAWLRSRVQLWLAHALFRNSGLGDLPKRMNDGPQLSGEDDYLLWAAHEIAVAVHTGQFALQPAYAAHPDWTEATVPVRLGPERDQQIVLGRREGGRRYLGEDLDALARASVQIEESCGLFGNGKWTGWATRPSCALCSRRSTHIFFSCLNALYGTIPRTAAEARRLVLNLAEIFRYFLQSERNLARWPRRWRSCAPISKSKSCG